MSRHEPMARVHHMLDHAREAVEMVRHRSRTDLCRHRLGRPGGLVRQTGGRDAHPQFGARSVPRPA